MNKWKVWIPAVLWILVIFTFSSQPYSKQDVRPWLKQQIPEKIVKEKLGHVKVHYDGSEISIQTKGVQGFIEFFIRKAAHVSSFAVLAVLIQWAVSRSWSTGIKGYILSFALALLYAGLDEWHQSFTPERTPKLTDVWIDTTGIFIGLWFIAAIRWGKRNILRPNGQQ